MPAELKKYSFLDDYSEGCHPSILQAMVQTNLVQQTAYGHDEYSEKAKVEIRRHIEQKNTAIYFVAGGTLANLIIVSSVLKSHEAVISAGSGHIVVRETGAIEATGHKIITVATNDGKLTPEHIETTLASNAHYPHMAKPRLVYISNATETGTVYCKAELEALSVTCKLNNLLLLLDGARLGVALASNISDLTMKDVAQLTDIFWIGGTKAGALIGEAIVIPNESLAHELEFHIKQRGALLAKGRLLGIQFDKLFSTGLFFELSKHANAMAQKLSVAIVDAGHSFSSQTESNQLFPILPNTVIEEMKKRFDFYVWEAIDSDHSVIRLVTSWATEESEVDSFRALLQEISS